MARRRDEVAPPLSGSRPARPCMASPPPTAFLRGPTRPLRYREPPVGTGGRVRHAGIHLQPRCRQVVVRGAPGSQLVQDRCRGSMALPRPDQPGPDPGLKTSSSPAATSEAGGPNGRAAYPGGKRRASVSVFRQDDEIYANLRTLGPLRPYSGVRPLGKPTPGPFGEHLQEIRR
jgi:hypothetical protein